MAQDTRLEVTLYSDDVLNGECEPLVLKDIAYVSLVSPETYGPPALIAPSRGREDATADVGEEVLYLSTRLVPAWKIKRVDSK